MTTTTPPASEARRRNIEAIYPLLPLQRALLLRSTGREDDPGLLHVRCVLEGPLEPSTLQRAWNEVIGHHTALRMSCQGTDDVGPMMVVRRHVSLPWAQHDWRDLDDTEQARRRSQFLADDRARGLELAEAPVMRVALIRLDDETHEMVWTCHHLFVDGWSSGLVLGDVVGTYSSLHTGSPLPPGPSDPYRRYHAWARQADPRESREYWTARLAGFAAPDRLPLIGSRTDGFASISRAVDRANETAIQAARATPNAYAQAAWALVLAQMLESDDVVFGATVAGRAVPIDDMESLVGMFSNVVPVRVAVDGETTVASWLRRLRDEQLTAQPHEHVFLSDIHAWSPVPGGTRLFETLLVVENFPSLSTNEADNIILSHWRSGVTTTFPLTLVVTVGDSWRAHATYDRAHFDAESVGRLLDAFEAALDALGRAVDRPVSATRAEVPEVRLARAELVPGGPTGEYTAPGDPIELSVARIWEEVLGLSTIGIRDDFFELGGTSIMAVRLFSEIERQLEKRLPLAALLESATIEHLADLIRGDAATRWECLVPIQAAGTQRPFFCVHAGEVHVLFYRELAARLGPDQPVLGLEPVGLDGTRAPLETIEAMAARYIEEMLAAYPRGPYRLVGYCLGASLGLEIACQLEAAGREVELLAVLDSGLPPSPRSQVARAWTALRTDGVPAFVSRVRARLRRQAARRRELRTAGANQRVTTDWIIEACNRAANSYEPRPCRVPITLIRSQEYVARRDKDHHLELRRFTSSLDVHVVAGRHDEILQEPNVREVASVIRRALRP